ncbi:MAG: ATP-binding protein [Clostridia bacterium]|nr:ATP-binding protein [Clostridia bacterium]
MNAKAAVCNQKGIHIEIREEKSAISGLDMIDTAAIFGNLTDNAIEAAEKTKEKRITIDIKRAGAYLSILIANSIDVSVLKENSELATSKEDKELHGIGIQSVKAVVEKYDGMIQFYEEDNEFCCHILLRKA